MRFIKGVVIGGLITTGLVMMYTESDLMNRKKVMKKGKKLLKKWEFFNFHRKDLNFRVYRIICVKFKNKPSYDKIKMS